MELVSIIVALIIVIMLITFGLVRLKWLQRYLESVEKSYKEHPEWFTEELL
jgi:predicted ferric reductase